MTLNVKVAQALVAARYVSHAMEAAAKVLGDALVVEAAQDAVAEARADEAYQEGLIADAETTPVAEIPTRMGSLPSG